MSLLVTGSIAVDSIKTPFGQRADCLGGSSIYFSMAASFFSPVRLVGVVGKDWPFDLRQVFADRDVDLQGLEVRTGSKTFRWQGSYTGDMNEAKTDKVELNVLAEAAPVIPDAFKDSSFVFLANTAPALQLELLNQLHRPKLAVADTMNLWIDTARGDLLGLLRRVNGLVLNEGEAGMLTGKNNLASAAKEIVKMGPQFVVIKKGEHGTLLLADQQEYFVLPAYPTDRVMDPTGAGDSFAGGMMGYLAREDNYEPATLKKAIAYGTAVASLVIEGFSLDRWQSAAMKDIEQRFQQLKKMVQF